MHLQDPILSGASSLHVRYVPVMFQQISLLCLGATLNAAHDLSPAWNASAMHGKPSRYSTSNQYSSGDLIHHGLHTHQSKLHDSARNRVILGLSRNYENRRDSNAYTAKRYGDKKQVKTHDSQDELRNKVAKYNSGRGLISSLIGLVQKGLVGGIADAAKHMTDTTLKVVRDTADITKDIVLGSAQIATNVAMDSANLTQHLAGHGLDITEKAFGWAVNTTMMIGKRIVQAPLRSIEPSINAAWAAHTFGVGLTAQMISDTADWFQGNWEAVKAMEYPGKHLIVMLYPRGLMSVVHSSTKEIMYMLDKGHALMTHAFAYKLYMSLKIVFGSVNAVLKLNMLNCIPLTPLKLKVNKNLIDTISVSQGKACGISHLKPVNNVSITRNDKKFLIVKTPWVLEDLSIHLTGVKVVGLGIIGTVLDNEELNTKVKRVKATGTVEFEAGSLLRFFRTHLEVDEIEGLVVSSPAEKKSGWMRSIEGLSGPLSNLVMGEINHALGKVEKMVFDYIAKM